jgi:protein O-GlcNAc transferase
MTLDEAMDQAIAHHKDGRLAEAERLYWAVLKAMPDHPAANYFLGTLADQAGHTEGGLPYLEAAARLRPDSPTYQGALAQALRSLGRLEQALACQTKVVDLRPDGPEGHAELAEILSEMGRNPDAAACYRKAIALRPDYAEAHCDLGGILREMGHYQTALDHLGKALALRPDMETALYNMALTLHDLGRLDDAVVCLKQALDLAPDQPVYLATLASVLTPLGRYDEAITQFRKALEIDPDNSAIHRWLLLSLTYNPSLTAGERFAEHRRFEAMHARPHYPVSVAFANSRDPGRRLRIGYLSSDFGNHPVGHNMIPVLEAHDPGAVEVFLYASMRDGDHPMTRRFKDRADCWRPVINLSDRQVADMIRADAIDILVVLAGRFDGNRPLVAAYRPAPVQVSYWDAATSGMEVMDALFTDRVHTPRNGPEQYAERPFRLPSLYIHYPIGDAPPTAPPPLLKNGYPTFGSFNNPAKLSEPTLALWAGVLRRVPDARLVLKFKDLFRSAPVARRIAGIFAGHGIDPARLDMRGGMDDKTSHLALYGDIDVALDTFPFNGATTTFEALWMGVPVVTLLGDTFMSRWAASMLTTLKLTGQVAASPADYVDICQRLVSDPDALAALRAGLRDRVAASPLCQPRPKARQVERAYRALWRRWCASPQGQDRHDP